MNKNKNKLIPKLRFPEFGNDDEWVLSPFSNYIKLYRGSSPRPIREYLTQSQTGVNWIKIGDTSSITDFIIRRVKEKITTRGAENSRKVKKGELILANSMSYGNTYELALDGCIYDGWFVLREYKKIFDKHFLLQILNSDYMQKQYKKLAAGGIVQNISSEIVYSTILPKTSKDEQKKIASCLSSLDELITAHKDKLQALKNHKKGLMQNLFPQEGQKVPNYRFPEFKKDQGWCQFSIEDLIDQNILFAPKDGNHGNIHPKSSDYVKSGIPFIMASDLRNGQIDFLNCAHLRKDQADSLQKGFSISGDVLLTHKGTVGEVVLLGDIAFPYIMLTPQVTYYRVKDKTKLLNGYLEAFFNSDSFQKNLFNISGGGTRAYVGITQQQTLKIVYPKKLAEQQKVASFFSTLNKVIATQMQKIEQLQEHKKGLMQRLFPKIES